jgi:raffinose/stachyose/melibiose transport system substrate-binding protein
MKWKSAIGKRLGLGLIVLGYVVSVYWVFTRSAPLIRERPVTISLAHWQIERGPPDGIAAAIKRYEELNPRVKVEQLAIPGAVYKQWMRSNLAGDTGADIIEWGSWLAGQKDIPARYFEPLTADLAKTNPYNRGTSQESVPWEKTFQDNLLGPRRDSPDPGQIYAVTLTEVTVRLFCNIALLRRITGVEAAPQTYDDLRKILAKVQAHAKRTGERINGLAGSRDNGLWISQTVFTGPLIGMNYQFDDSGYLYLYNRQVLAAYLEGRWNYRRPEVKAGLQLVREVSQAMKPGFLQLRRDDAMLEFFSGNAVFLFTGTWDATSLRRMAPFEIVPMRLPSVTPDDPVVGRYIKGLGGEGIGETAMAMYLNKSSPHKAEALDFLRFITSVEGNQLFTDHSLWLPSVKGVKLPEEIKSFRSYQQGYAIGQAPYDSIGSEVSMTWEKNFYQLAGEGGGVDRFAEALDRVMPAAIRADLQDEARNTLLLVKPQDTQIVAYAQLADDSPAGQRARQRQQENEAGQTMSEGLAFQMKLQLERSKGAELK